MLCKKCVLPERKPDILLNESGICNVCLDFDRKKALKSGKLLESELVKVLNKYRGKEKYDCLVMCSGGKDSTSSLYYMIKRYRLNPLAFTFDNGFENETAIKNVKKAVNILGCDWVYFKSGFMTDMYREIVKTKSRFPLCPLCSLWYMELTYRVATQYNLPLIIGGWTEGQLNREFGNAGSKGSLQSEGAKPELEFVLLCQTIPGFIEKMRKKYPGYKNFPREMEEVKKKYKISKRVIMLSPHWFLPSMPEEYTELIKKELSWEPIAGSYPGDSGNCDLNLLGSYLSMQGYDFTHFHVEMSKLIRLGELSREEALRKLEINIDKEPSSSIISSVLKKLGCQRSDLEV